MEGCNLEAAFGQQTDRAGSTGGRANAAGRQAGSTHTQAAISQQCQHGLGAARLTWNSSCALDISSSGVMMPSCASSVASMPGGSGGSAAGRGSGGGGG